MISGFDLFPISAYIVLCTALQDSILPVAIKDERPRPKEGILSRSGHTLISILLKGGLEGVSGKTCFEMPPIVDLNIPEVVHHRLSIHK